MAKTPSKLELLREMREKSNGKKAKAPKEPKPKVEVIAKARAKAKADKAAGNGDRGAKSLAIASLLKRAKGCTRKDALEATGWPTISMQAMAEQLGIKIRVEKEPGQPTRYFGA